MIIRRATPFLWGLALVAGLLWPGRLVGPLDGAPLDRPAEVLAIGLLFPMLWYLDPEFMRSGPARGLVAGLSTWKIAGALLLAQTGWCGAFLTKYPSPIDSYRLDRSWDVRTLWTPSPPACSAIVSRPYETLADFPAWIINVPFGAHRSLESGEDWLPTEGPRPPDGAYAMNVEGFMYPRAAGVLSFELGGDVRLSGAIDGAPIGDQRSGTIRVGLDRGPHTVDLHLDLQRADWRFVPAWNGADVFRAVPTSTSPLTGLDRAFAGWGAWITPVLVLTLLGGWTASAARHVGPGIRLGTWAMASALSMIAIGALIDRPGVRFALLGLLAGVLVPVPARLRTASGAFLLVGVAWLSFFVGRSLHEIGRFTVYTFGDDWLTFQRFAHRIFMQGYWLEGGERTFWHQPLYRWIVGVLHLVFGDSSVGELYWDAFGLLVGALFAFGVVNRLAGFRPGIVAAALTLITMALGPNWYIIGRGLAEISASAWIYLAAIGLMLARDGAARYALLAGACATLAFYTRLNHLPLTIALVALALPDRVSAGSLFDWRAWWDRLPKRVAATYLALLAIGVGAFVARTWYYTGQPSLFAGTTRVHNATGLGLTIGSMWSPSAWRSAGESILMIVTVQDPPRLDVRSLLVVGGVCCSLLAVVGAPVVRHLPLSLVVMCLGSVAGGLVARGIAYPGRFSIHLIPIAISLSVSAIALALGVRAPAPQVEKAGV